METPGSVVVKKEKTPAPNGGSALTKHFIKREDRGLTGLDGLVEGTVPLHFNDGVGATEFRKAGFNSSTVHLERGQKRAGLRLQGFHLGGVRTIGDGLQPASKTKCWCALEAGL